MEGRPDHLGPPWWSCWTVGARVRRAASSEAQHGQGTSTARAARSLDALEPRGRLGAEGGRPRTLSRKGRSLPRSLARSQSPAGALPLGQAGLLPVASVQLHPPPRETWGN